MNSNPKLETIKDRQSIDFKTEECTINDNTSQNTYYLRLTSADIEMIADAINE